MVHHIFHVIAKKVPLLELRLRQAEMNKTPAEFVREIMLSTFYITVGIGFAIFLLLVSFGKNPIIVLALLAPVFILLTWYFLKLPEAKILRKSKEIDKEIVFAGKFMIIELNSGISLYDVLKNIGDNYGGIGKYFNNIVQDIDLGTETEVALNNAILHNPSKNFRKVMWQLANALRTGANVSNSINTVLEQINKEQMIEVEKYGKKLNPIAVFYLMLAVILPSLGMVMVVVFASFANFPLTLPVLLFIVGFFGFLQFTFYAVIKANRPAIEL